MVVGFCRVCVIDAILAKSPADYVRRATVPAGSPTLGLGHLQFEALITIARGRGGDWGGINYPLHAVEYKRRAGRQVRDHVHRAERLGPSAHAAIT